MNKKIKIAILIDQLVTGGVQKTAIEEVRNLRKLGCDSKLLILMRKGFEAENKYLIKDVPHEFLSDRYPKLLQKNFKLPFFTFLSTLHLTSPVLAPLEVKSKEFDIIVSHGTTTSLTTWSLAFWCKIPYLAIVHDPMNYILDKVYSKTPLKYFFPIMKPVAQILESVFIKAASLCLVDSQVHARYLVKTYGVKPLVLYLGINPPSKLHTKRGNAIISFGRWDAGKHPEFLLRLIKSIPKTQLILAGNWTNKQDLQEFKNLANKLKITKKVKIIPQYSDKKLGKICDLGQVWVHPHFEAFSLSALEAASHGLPLVIPAKSGVTELFQNGTHGFFPKNVNIVNLKRAVLPLLKNKLLAIEMGRKAAVVASNYTHKYRSKLLLAAIRKIMPEEKPVKIIALETGHIVGSLVAGGDKLLEEMVKRVKNHLDLTVIVPEIGSQHWKKSGVMVNLKLLPKNIFEKGTGPFLVFLNYLIRIWQSFFTLRKIIKASQNRIILIYSSTGIFPDVIPAFLIKLFKPDIKWLARIHHLSSPPHKRHGRFWVNFGSYFLQKLSLTATQRKADSILVLNSKLKKELVKVGFSTNKMVILGGGVDFLEISKFKPVKNYHFDGVFLGRIHPAKGVFDLVPIWSKVTQDFTFAKLAIIGSGPRELTMSLNSQIKRLGFERSIILKGYLPQNQVWSILKQTKVFLFTDHEAGFGLAVAEAMAAGLPVVGWDIGILGNVFQMGFLKVPFGDFKNFANKISKLLKNKNLYYKLSKEAKREASKLDWKRTSQKFISILDKVSQKVKK